MNATADRKKKELGSVVPEDGVYGRETVQDTARENEVAVWLTSSSRHVVKFCLIPADDSRGEIRAPAVQVVDVRPGEPERSTRPQQHIASRLGEEKNRSEWLVLRHVRLLLLLNSIPHTAAGGLL
jgi:hypothetical protein